MSAPGHAPQPTGRLGVYVHVPFCARRCPYCDFAVVVTRRIPDREYRDAVLAELARRATAFQDRTLQTLYFGGGTPAMWSPASLGAVIDAVAQRFGAPPIETTVEANPEDLTSAGLTQLRSVGVDRLSLGVQSFEAATLAVLGRAHTPQQARETVVAAADVGFRHLSVDLILAAPGDGPRRVDAELEALAQLGDTIDHVSAYDLTLEPRTSLAVRTERGLLPPVPDEVRAEASAALGDGLRSLGFERYEVSNWARPGGRARHNAAYWRGDEYLGLGIGAHSLRLDAAGPVREANGSRLRDYLADERTLARTAEHLAASTHLAELVMVGMRTTDGVDLQDVEARWSADARAAVARLAERWLRRGHAELRDHRVVPTTPGLDWADAFGADALAELTAPTSEAGSREAARSATYAPRSSPPALDAEGTTRDGAPQPKT